MPFFELADPDIHFASRKFSWRSYSAASTLTTAEQVKIVDAKEFSRDALNPKLQSYVVRAATILVMKSMHPDRQARLAVIKLKELKELGIPPRICLLCLRQGRR